MGKGLLILFLFTLTLNSSNGQSGHCHAILTSQGPGETVTFTDPFSNNTIQQHAGLINGSIDGNQTQFYSNDFQRDLNLPDGSYFDSSTATDPKVVYILNYYFPLIQDPPGKLYDINKETAATQLAIWHFVCGLNANSVTENEIKLRALNIIQDANINSGNLFVPYTLDILPDVDPDFFVIQTTDCFGNGISVNNIELSLTQTSGKLSAYSVNTIDGLSPPVQVINTSTGLLNAIGNCIIPPGILFASANHNRRSVLLAKPAIGRKSISYDWGALPVEMSAFTYTLNSNNVELNWTTVSEINNSGFEIERLAREGHWSMVGSVLGFGTTSAPHSYSFSDRGLNSGKYNYRLKQIDYNGNFEYFNLNSEVVIGAPEKFILDQNYPNPFNPNTVISYMLPVSSYTLLKVYDMIGNEIKTLVNKNQNAGSYKVEFDGRNLSSGIYYYKLTAGSMNGSTDFNEVKKMLLVK